MAILLRRQISDEEKDRVIQRFGRVCFATGHPIPETESVYFDHIKAFAEGGVTEIENIAPMCEKHNKQKGRLPLYDFKIKLKMDEFFEKGDTLTLKDELKFLKEHKEIEEYGNKVIIVESNENEIQIEIENKRNNFALYKCPITKWKYFYGILPITVLNSDDDEDNKIGLQPRYLIFDKVFELFRHFQKHPVLQPSICRINNGKILVFDGQHKIAALLWGGRKYFECKVYLDPDPNLLNKTNISAHDKFCQTRFYSSIMVAKLGNQFGREFEDYKNFEEDTIKSEAGFLHFLKEKEQLTTGEVNKRFRSFLINSVLNDENNKLNRLVSKSNRSSDEYPITIDMLQKSILSVFLYTEPVDDDMTTDKYKRDLEIQNLVRLCNILDEEAFCNWDGSRPKTDLIQNKLNRMLRSKSIMAWSELFQDAVCAKLNIHDSDQRKMPFYQFIDDDQFQQIRYVTRRLIDWNMWQSPPDGEIDRVLADNKSEVKKFFREKGLSTGYLMGAKE